MPLNNLTLKKERMNFSVVFLSLVHLFIEQHYGCLIQIPLNNKIDMNDEL